MFTASRFRRAAGWAAAALALALGPVVFVVATGAPASAATFTVDDTADGAPVASDCTTPVAGSCSLRDAIAAASASAGPDTISLATGTTYTLSSCDAATGRALRLTVSSTVTIAGNGATIQQTCALSSGNGVIAVVSAGTVNVRDVTLTGANSTDGTGGLQAGNDNVVLDVENTTITGNSASFQPAIGTAGALTVHNSTITNNTATAGDGAVRTFNDVAVIVNSTITGNTAATSGGGISSSQGGATIVYSTVTGNSAPTGANISVPGGSFTSFGSVVGDPLGGGANCASAGTSNGYNFEVGTNSCGFTTTTDTSDGADPLLGALADNGGPTQTLLPATGSPLLDAIPTTDCQADGASGVTTDQRGITRPQGTGCDIGAVEVVVVTPEPPAPTPAPTPAAAVVVPPTFTG